jgi:hypothetical protein
MVAEYSDINNFQTSIKEENEIEILTFSGLCMHSAYVVKKIEYETKKDVLHIIVFLSWVDKKGKSGSFNESVVIPSDINVVVFGKNKKTIWARSIL